MGLSLLLFFSENELILKTNTLCWPVTDTNRHEILTWHVAVLFSYPDLEFRMTIQRIHKGALRQDVSWFSIIGGSLESP